MDSEWEEEGGGTAMVGECGLGLLDRQGMI